MPDPASALFFQMRFSRRAPGSPPWYCYGHWPMTVGSGWPTSPQELEAETQRF